LITKDKIKNFFFFLW